MTDPSLYSFSDEFLSALSQANERSDQPTYYSQEDVPNEQENDSDSDDKYNDLYDKYNELLGKLNNLSQSPQQDNYEPSYNESDYPEDDSNYWIDFINKNVLNEYDDWGNDTSTNYNGDIENAFTSGLLPNTTGTGTRAERHNNPGNLKYATWEQTYGAVKGELAPDGGYYAHFPDSQSGLNAQKHLLSGKTYNSKTVDDALRLYSNNEYDGSIYPEIRNKKISELSSDEFDNLVKKQVVREDFHYAKQLGIRQYGGGEHDKHYVDSILNANQNLNFVQRYLYPNKYPVINNSDGTYSTELMAQSDNFIYPTIIQGGDGKLTKLSPQDAYKYAMNTHQYIQFPKESDAVWFADNGYKLGTQHK